VSSCTAGRHEFITPKVVRRDHGRLRQHGIPYGRFRSMGHELNEAVLRRLATT